MMYDNICIDKKIFLISIFISITIIYIFFNSITKEINDKSEAKLSNLLYKSINKLTRTKNKQTQPGNTTHDNIVLKLTPDNEAPEIEEPVKYIQPVKYIYKQPIKKVQPIKYKEQIIRPVVTTYENIPVHIPQIAQPQIDPVRERDAAVINDALYPPYSRTERPVFDELIKNFNTNISTRGSQDTFRQIGFLINPDKSKMDMAGNNWRLFGRQSYRGSTIGEYYVLPVDVTYANLKVFITDSMMVNEKLRDMYALPNSMTLRSPFFNDTPYQVVELPKPDLNSGYV